MNGFTKIFNHREDSSNRLRRNRGFSTIELMMAIAVGAIMLGIALPTFSNLMHKNRLSATASELYGSLSVARNVAIKRREPVSVCPSTDGSSCVTSGYDWSAGWIVFEDPDHANGPANAAAVIRYVSSIHDRVNIQSFGNGDDYVTFNPTGDARYTPGQFILCHQETSAMSKSLSVSAVGRIDVETRNQTDCSAEG